MGGKKRKGGWEGYRRGIKKIRKEREEEKDRKCLCLIADHLCKR